MIQYGIVEPPPQQLHLWGRYSVPVGRRCLIKLTFNTGSTLTHVRPMLSDIMLLITSIEADVVPHYRQL